VQTALFGYYGLKLPACYEAVAARHMPAFPSIDDFVLTPSKQARLKVFGIGLAKTGTTSLHFALEMLGFRSIHASTFVARIVKQEIRNRKALLSTIENEYDAFSDWPISYLYRLLDRRFPDSKFILTVRNARDRYHSARRHIEEDQLRRAKGLPHAWIDIEPESEFITESELHTAKVKKYFQHRPNDLLVMRIVEGEGWTPLCDFLGVAVPIQRFPHHSPVASDQTHFVRTSPMALEYEEESQASEGESSSTAEMVPSTAESDLAHGLQNPERSETH